MAECLLCRERESPMQRQIEIFSSEGISLNICGIVAKHFWIRPDRDLFPEPVICRSCWDAVSDFHVFYQRVIAVHHHYEFTVIDAEVDPLPHEVQLKFEDLSTVEATGDTFFDTEVKMEVHDLDLLPQIEVIEDSLNMSDRAQRATRRGRFRENTPPTNTTMISACSSPIPSTSKRIKTENTASSTTIPSASLNNSEIDVLSETVPNDDTKIKLFANRRKRASGKQKKKGGAPKKPRGRSKKTNVHETITTNEQNLEMDILSETVPNDDTQIKSFAKRRKRASGKQNKKGGAPKKPRGRSKKTNVHETITTNEQNVSPTKEDQPNDDLLMIAEKSSVENDRAHSLADFDDDDDGEGVLGTKDSGENSDNDKDETWEEPRPRIPGPRMTSEELARMHAQQDEYDEIFAKFFERIECPKCQLPVKNYTEMRRHFRASHNDIQGYMLCCGRKFRQRKALAEHIFLHWNPEHFKCTTCGRILQESRALEAHELTHTNPPDPTLRQMFQCDKCPRKYMSMRAVEHHTISKHTPKSEYKFECPECHKKLPTDRTMKDHIKNVHDPESAVICDKCGKDLRSQYNLKKHHELEHTDGPRPTPIPVQCEICGQWLRQKASLKQHMISLHSNDGTEHRCHICNKTSSNSRALKRHVYVVHECDRRYKCTFCEKAFNRPQDLREHTSTHTGEVLYTCPNCPMTFFSCANMYTHRKRLHKAELAADREKRKRPNIMGQAKAATAENRHLAIIRPSL